MPDFRSLLCSDPAVRARYRVRVLYEAEPTLQGLRFRDGPEWALVPWAEVVRALAAEVGEPEGVRTIVFDLVTDLWAPAEPGFEGPACRVLRFDADPGESAMAAARAIERALSPEQLSASLKSVATDGIPTRWYPDLEALEHATLALLPFGDSEPKSE